MALIGIAILTGYFSGVGAIFWFVRFHRGVTEARFVDLACPWRRGNYDVARGNHYIALGQQKFSEKAFSEAHRLLRTGLALAPANREGRLLLARLSAAMKQHETARQLLCDGLVHHRHDAHFVGAVIGFLLERQEDEVVVALAREYLARPIRDLETMRVFALAGATASYARGNYDAAEDFLHADGPLCRSRNARLLAAKLEGERGYRDLALVQLRQLALEWPDDGEIHHDLVQMLNQAGRVDESRRRTLAFQIAHPDSGKLRLELVRAFHAAGDSIGTRREIDALLRDFRPNTTTMLELAAFAADIGDPSLVRSAGSIGSTDPDVKEAFAFLEAEASVVAGDYRGALNLIHEFAANGGNERSRGLLLCLQALAHTGLGDASAGRLFLSSYLQQSHLQSGNLLAVAKRLSALAAEEPARRALVRALEIDPQNQAVLARLLELDLELNRVDEMPAHVRQFVTMRRPSPDILRVVQQKLGSDLFLFSAAAPEALKAVDKALATLRVRPAGAIRLSSVN